MASAPAQQVIPQWTKRAATSISRPNKDNVRETQLYRVSLRDKSLTRITQDAGSHSAKIAPDASAFIDTYSTAATPSRQDLYRMDGTKVAVVNEGKVPELAEYKLAPVEFVEVTADDGTN